jgi:hypothetical protein
LFFFGAKQMKKNQVKKLYKVRGAGESLHSKKRTQTREFIIKELAKMFSSVFKIKVDTSGTLEEMVKSFRKHLPLDAKSLNADKEKLRQSCLHIAKKFNDIFGQDFIDTKSSTEELCGDISDKLYSLTVQFNGEYFDLLAGAKTLIRNMHTMIDALKQSFRNLVQKNHGPVVEDFHQKSLQVLESLVKNLQIIVDEKGGKDVLDEVHRAKNIKKYFRTFDNKHGMALSKIFDSTYQVSRTMNEVEKLGKKIGLTLVEIKKFAKLPNPAAAFSESVYSKIQKSKDFDEHLKVYEKLRELLGDKDIVISLGSGETTPFKDLKKKSEEKVHRMVRLFFDAFNSCWDKIYLYAKEMLRDIRAGKIVINRDLMLLAQDLENIPKVDNLKQYYQFAGAVDKFESTYERDNFVRQIKLIINKLHELNKNNKSKCIENMIREFEKVLEIIDESVRRFLEKPGITVEGSGLQDLINKGKQMLNLGVEKLDQTSEILGKSEKVVESMRRDYNVTSLDHFHDIARELTMEMRRKEILDRFSSLSKVNKKIYENYESITAKTVAQYKDEILKMDVRYKIYTGEQYKKKIVQSLGNIANTVGAIDNTNFSVTTIAANGTEALTSYGIDGGNVAIMSTHPYFIAPVDFETNPSDYSSTKMFYFAAEPGHLEKKLEKLNEENMDKYIRLLETAENLEIFYKNYMDSVIEHPKHVENILLDFQTEIFMKQTEKSEFIGARRGDLDDPVGFLNEKLKEYGYDIACTTFATPNNGNDHVITFSDNSTLTIPGAKLRDIVYPKDVYLGLNIALQDKSQYAHPGGNATTASTKQLHDLQEFVGKLNAHSLKNLISVFARITNYEGTENYMYSEEIFENLVAYGYNDKVKGMDFNALRDLLITSMFGAICMTVDVYSMVNKRVESAYGLFDNTTRVILGSGDVKINPKLTEIYIRVPLLIRFYKQFVFDTQVDKQIRMELRLEGPMKRLYKYCTDEYVSGDKILKIVESCNNLYEMYKNTSDPCFSIMLHIAEDANSKLGYMIYEQNMDMEIPNQKLLGSKLMLERGPKKTMPSDKYMSVVKSVGEKYKNLLYMFDSAAQKKITIIIDDIKNKFANINKTTFVQELNNFSNFIKLKEQELDQSVDKQKTLGEILSEFTGKNISTEQYRKLGQREFYEISAQIITEIRAKYENNINNIPQFTEVLARFTQSNFEPRKSRYFTQTLIQFYNGHLASLFNNSGEDDIDMVFAEKLLRADPQTSRFLITLFNELNDPKSDGKTIAIWYPENRKLWKQFVEKTGNAEEEQIQVLGSRDFKKGHYFNTHTCPFMQSVNDIKNDAQYRAFFDIVLLHDNDSVFFGDLNEVLGQIKTEFIANDLTDFSDGVGPVEKYGSRFINQYIAFEKLLGKKIEIRERSCGLANFNVWAFDNNAIINLYSKIIATKNKFERKPEYPFTWLSFVKNKEYYLERINGDFKFYEKYLLNPCDKPAAAVRQTLDLYPIVTNKTKFYSNLSAESSDHKILQYHDSHIDGRINYMKFYCFEWLLTKSKKGKPTFIDAACYPINYKEKKSYTSFNTLVKKKWGPSIVTHYVYAANTVQNHAKFSKIADYLFAAYGQTICMKRIGSGAANPSFSPNPDNPLDISVAQLPSKNFESYKSQQLKDKDYTLTGTYDIDTFTEICIWETLKHINDEKILGEKIPILILNMVNNFRKIKVVLPNSVDFSHIENYMKCKGISNIEKNYEKYVHNNLISEIKRYSYNDMVFIKTQPDILTLPFKAFTLAKTKLVAQYNFPLVADDDKTVCDFLLNPVIKGIGIDSISQYVDHTADNADQLDDGNVGFRDRTINRSVTLLKFFCSYFRFFASTPQYKFYTYAAANNKYNEIKKSLYPFEKFYEICNTKDIEPTDVYKAIYQLIAVTSHIDNADTDIEQEITDLSQQKVLSCLSTTSSFDLNKTTTIPTANKDTFFKGILNDIYDIFPHFKDFMNMSIYMIFCSAHFNPVIDHQLGALTWLKNETYVDDETIYTSCMLKNPTTGLWAAGGANAADEAGSGVRKLQFDFMVNKCKNIIKANYFYEIMYNRIIDILSAVGNQANRMDTVISQAAFGTSLAFSGILCDTYDNISSATGIGDYIKSLAPVLKDFSYLSYKSAGLVANEIIAGTILPPQGETAVDYAHKFIVSKKGFSEPIKVEHIAVRAIPNITQLNGSNEIFYKNSGVLPLTGNLTAGAYEYCQNKFVGDFRYPSNWHNDIIANIPPINIGAMSITYNRSLMDKITYKTSEKELKPITASELYNSVTFLISRSERFKKDMRNLSSVLKNLPQFNNTEEFNELDTNHGYANDFYEFLWSFNNELVSVSGEKKGAENKILIDYGKLIETVKLFVKNHQGDVDKNLYEFLNNLTEKYSTNMKAINVAYKNAIDQSIGVFEEYFKYKFVDLETQFAKLFTKYIDKFSHIAVINVTNVPPTRYFYSKIINPIFEGELASFFEKNRTIYMDVKLYENVIYAYTTMNPAKPGEKTFVQDNFELVPEYLKIKMRRYLPSLKRSFSNFGKKCVFFKDLMTYFAQSNGLMNVQKLINMCEIVGNIMTDIENLISVPIMFGELGKDRIKAHKAVYNELPLLPLSTFLPITKKQAFAKDLLYASAPVLKGLDINKSNYPGVFEIMEFFNKGCKKGETLTEKSAIELATVLRDLMLVLYDYNDNKKLVNYKDAIIYNYDLPEELTSLDTALGVLQENRKSTAIKIYLKEENEVADINHIYINLIDKNFMPINLRMLYKTVLFSHINLMGSSYVNSNTDNIFYLTDLETQLPPKLATYLKTDTKLLNASELLIESNYK